MSSPFNDGKFKTTMSVVWSLHVSFVEKDTFHVFIPETGLNSKQEPNFMILITT